MGDCSRCFDERRSPRDIRDEKTATAGAAVLIGKQAIGSGRGHLSAPVRGRIATDVSVKKVVAEIRLEIQQPAAPLYPAPRRSSLKPPK